MTITSSLHFNDVSIISAKVNHSVIVTLTYLVLSAKRLKTSNVNSFLFFLRLRLNHLILYKINVCLIQTFKTLL